MTMPAAPTLHEMETRMPTPPSHTFREQPVSSPGSHQEQGRNKGKQFDSVTGAEEYN